MKPETAISPATSKEEEDNTGEAGKVSRLEIKNPAIVRGVFLMIYFCYLRPAFTPPFIFIALWREALIPDAAFLVAERICELFIVFAMDA